MICIDAQSKYFAIAMLGITLISMRMIDFGTLNSDTELNVFNKIIKSIASISYEVYLIQYPKFVLLPAAEIVFDDLFL